MRHSNAVSIALVTLMVLALAGCGTTYKFMGRTPEAEASDAVDGASEQYKRGNASLAYNAIDKALLLPTGAEKVRALFLREPKLADGYTQYLRTQVTRVDSPYVARYLKNTINHADTVLPKETITEIDAALESRVASGNASGLILFDFSENYSAFKSLQTPEQKQKIAEHTIAKLQDPTSYVRPVSPLMLYASEVGVSSPMGQRIKSQLPTMNLRRSEMPDVARVYPDFAADQAATASAKVRLIVEPKDRLFQEDLAARMRLDLKGIEFVQDDGPQVVTVTVERLRYTENRLPDRTETVTYQQYEVNLAGAILLMPRNASYQYDVRTSGGEIEYGFAVKASQSGKQFADDLLRDKVAYSISTCSNARIQNVFGGVQRAEFVANDDMVRRCSGGTNERGMENLRAEVYSRITRQIATLPPIARVQLLAD